MTNPQGLAGGVPLQISETWINTGPKLQLEFSRVSKDGRLTLVIDKSSPDSCLTFHASSAFSDLDSAVENLRLREGMPGPKRVGVLRKSDPTSACFPDISEWFTKQEYDAVIWTALKPNFLEKTGIQFSVENAIRYLATLNGEVRERAYSYFVDAPDGIDTPLRRFARWPESTAIHEAGHFIAAICLNLQTDWLAHIHYPSHPGSPGHKVSGHRNDPAELALNLAGPWAQIVYFPRSLRADRRAVFERAERVIVPEVSCADPQWTQLYGYTGWNATDINAAVTYHTFGNQPVIEFGMTRLEVLKAVDWNLGRWIKRPTQKQAIRLISDRLTKSPGILEGETLSSLRSDVLKLLPQDERDGILPEDLR